MDQEWNEFDLLNMWEQQNGRLHVKWRKVFIAHPAIPELLKYPFEDIGWAIEYELIKRLDEVLKKVQEFSQDSARDAWIENRKAQLERITDVNNIDLQDSSEDLIKWGEQDSPPFN